VDIADVLTTARLDSFADAGLVRRFALGITGIEVTQATQYFESDQHLTDAADRGSDNSIRLVAGKPSWVRVYPWSLIGASGLTGTLEVQRRSLGFLWSTVATLSADPSSATSVSGALVASYAATRGSLDETVNFVIPADEMIGHLRLIARLTAGSQTAESTVYVPVTLRQTLKLAGVMISYNGPASSAPNAPNLTLAAPTLADLQAMAGTALTLFPVESTAQFRTAGTLVQTKHLQDTSFPTSGCGVEWDALHGRVANARTADGNKPGWIYYGLLPEATPRGPVGGCGGGGVAVGPINRPGTLAHEAGHACGLEHAPSGGAPNPDPSFPAYEPYDPANTPMGTIGEYGLNVNNGNIATPDVFFDLMGYAGPSWISPYHYGKLLNNDRLTPVTVGMDQPWWKDLVWQEILKWPPIPDPPDPPFDLELPVYPPSYLQDVVSLIVKVERGRVADVLHVARTRAHTALRGDQTAFTARLLDGEGAVLAEAPLTRLETGASGCGCGGHGKEPDSFLAQGLVADAAPGAALEIAEAGEVVWRREAPGEPPRLGTTNVKVDKRGTATVTWEASRGVVELWLRWSRDGEEWHAIATGLEGTRARIAAGQLPPGDGLIQVVAHDGFFSTASEPVRVTIPERAPHAAILHPVDGATYRAGRTVRLLAAAEEGAGEATWLVDGKEVARGLDAFTALEAGKRKISLRLGDARPVSVSVIISD
jgi:peptidase M66-like protein